jgi:magnesium-transporting ATPase (P-type)
VPYIIKPQTACNRYFHKRFETGSICYISLVFGQVFFTAKNQITSIEIRRKSIHMVVWVLVGQMVPILVVDWMHKTVESCTCQENLRFLLNIVTLQITSVLLQIMWLTNSSYFKEEESFRKR